MRTPAMNKAAMNKAAMSNPELNRLTRATTGREEAAQSDFGEALDAQTAELRAAWLAIGAVLPTADEPPSEAAIWARIAAQTPRPIQRRGVGRPTARFWAAAAAVLVIGVATFLARDVPQASNEKRAAALPRPEPMPAVVSVWNDPLEEDFAAAQRGIALLQSTWRAPATTADRLGRRIDELIFAIESDTL
jgi:hypothetical protein